jgi:NCS1 family nucleobase:cation symporter-1
VAANVVSPANAFSNAWPRGISFRTGGIITGILGIAMMPWKLLADFETYLFTWLVGYSGFLGPIAGILICDYYLLRRKTLVVQDLYQRGGIYEYSRGVNWSAVMALVAGSGTAFVGLIYEPLKYFYSYAWFVGFGVGFVAYFALMTLFTPVAEAAID